MEYIAVCSFTTSVIATGTHMLYGITCHPAEVTFPPLPPAELGTRFSDTGGKQG